jgi:hypothetical protein
MHVERIIKSNLRKGCKIPQGRKREIEGHIRKRFNGF